MVLGGISPAGRYNLAPFGGLAYAERDTRVLFAALRVQTALLSHLWFLGLSARFVTPEDILRRWQHRSIEGEMWPDAREACKSEYLNCLARFASDLLGDVRLILFPSFYSCVNIVICAEVFIKVRSVDVRMMIIWLSRILLKCLLT